MKRKLSLFGCIVAVGALLLCFHQLRSKTKPEIDSSNKDANYESSNSVLDKELSTNVTKSRYPLDPYTLVEAKNRPMRLNREELFKFSELVENFKFRLLEQEMKGVHISRRGSSQYVITIDPIEEDARSVLVNEFAFEISEFIDSVEEQNYLDRLMVEADRYIINSLGSKDFGAEGRSIEISIHEGEFIGNKQKDPWYSYIVKTGSRLDSGSNLIEDTSASPFLLPYVKAIFNTENI